MSTFYMSTFTLVFDCPHSKVARGSLVIFFKKMLIMREVILSVNVYTFFTLLFTLYLQFFDTLLTVF
jgi:hypothetical protein